MQRGRTKSERLAQEQIRIQVVRRVLAGEKVPELARILGYPRQTIYRWVSDCREGGEAALRASKASGAQAKLSKNQVVRLAKLIRSKNPLQLGFAFALWTRDMIRELIRREFGIKMAVRSVGNLLHRLGFSAQRPLKRAYEQNPQAVAKWVRTEYPRIRREAQARKANIFFGDESGIRSDYHSGTTWGPRGKTPIVARTGKRVSCNMLSAVSARGKMRFMIRQGTVGATVFIGFLKRLLHGERKPIYLIVDGHSSHKAKQTSRFVASTKGKLRMYFLPGYAPEINPDELVWAHVKHHRIGRQSVQDAADLTAKVYSALRRLQQRPHIVRSFFRKATTLYAA
jgi:transposase